MWNILVIYMAKSTSATQPLGQPRPSQGIRDTPNHNTDGKMQEPSVTKSPLKKHKTHHIQIKI